MINDYKEVKECVYKDEHYSVRDNGAVMRHLREGKKPRRDDGVWTFGVKNSQNGYMMLGQHRVHIIVATAFLGTRDSKGHVVDHIDTNRCNNRVENLRWFTRLENALNNEITKSKIIYICGSIEAFLENPNILFEQLRKVKEPSLEWMRPVTSEEAKNAYENVKKYWKKQTDNPQPLAGGVLNEDIFQNSNPSNRAQSDIAILDNSNCQGNVSDNIFAGKQNGETICSLPQRSMEHRNDNLMGNSDYISFDGWSNSSEELLSKPISKHIANGDEVETNLIKAQLPDIAWQQNWKTPAIFMRCPVSIGNNPLQEYYNNLEIGDNYSYTVFRDDSSVQKVEDKAYTKDSKAIVVLGSSNDFIKLSKIHFSNGKFIHEYLRKFWVDQKQAALESFISEQGLECTVEEYYRNRRFSESNLVKAKFPNTAWQINWKTPANFLCCPTSIGKNPIEEYYRRIVIGAEYNYTEYNGIRSTQKIINKALVSNDNTILVLSNSPTNIIKPYALSKIYFYEGKFIHENLGTFFQEVGARKYFIIEQGAEWTEGDTFDDYCR